MPLALLAIGSYLDSAKYHVVIIDGRLEDDPVSKILWLCPGSILMCTLYRSNKKISGILNLHQRCRSGKPELTAGKSYQQYVYF